MPGKKILVADDNDGIAEILFEYLLKEGFEPVRAADGNEALILFGRENPALILLDVMMPGIDGYQVCREIRKTSDVPVIMLTAKGEDRDKIMGLENGADDYVVKPFSPREVMARIRAVLRRIDVTEEQKTGELHFGRLSVRIADYDVLYDGKPVRLTKKEIEILWLLASNPGRVFTRENLLNSVWGYDYYGDARTVDTHIKRLRAKLKAVGDDNWDIATIWGVGYKFEVKAS